ESAAAMVKVPILEDGLPSLRLNADDPKKPYGDVEYAAPGYQDDGKKRYPIDNEEHITHAWDYIGQGKNADKYSSSELKLIKARIIAAWKAKIDKDGPPSAAKDNSVWPNEETMEPKD